MPAITSDFSGAFTTYSIRVQAYRRVILIPGTTPITAPATTTGQGPFAILSLIS